MMGDDDNKVNQGILFAFCAGDGCDGATGVRLQFELHPTRNMKWSGTQVHPRVSNMAQNPLEAATTEKT